MNPTVLDFLDRATIKSTEVAQVVHFEGDKTKGVGVFELKSGVYELVFVNGATTASFYATDYAEAVKIHNDVRMNGSSVLPYFPKEKMNGI